MKNDTYLRQSGKELVLGNGNMEVRINRTTGTISKLIHRKKRFPWNTASGGLEIYDGLAEKYFRAGETPERTITRITKGREPALTLTRRFTRANFLVKETFRSAEDAVHWEVELVLDKGKPERSIEIRQLVPWPKQPWEWRIWSANFNFPSRTFNVAGLHLEYGDVSFGTVIPGFTVYHPEKGVGLAVVKPFGPPTPRLRFYFMDNHSDGVQVENDLLGLRRGKPIRVAVMLRFHEGCFRPTLAWLFKKYPDYFLPGNPKVRELEGGSIFGPPHVTEGDAKRLEKAGVVWYEIHHSMPYYGQYCPEEPQWLDGSSPPLSMKRRQKPITPRVINNCGKTLGRHGIGTLLYFQVTGDAWLPALGKRFPESLARKADGNLYSIAVDRAFINSDPALPFGKEMQRQIKCVLERYPDTSGIFLDCACYNCNDFAHDDGLTMYRGKPIYRYRFNYDRHLPEFVNALHKNGKFIYSNCPHDIELQKGFDGNMAESSATIAGTMKYMHLAKPLLFFAYCKDEADVEDMFQECLLAGASWSAWVRLSHSWFIKKGLTAGQRKIFERYVPLCKRLLGRRILLEPNPLSIPKRGGVFAGEGIEVTMGDEQSAPLVGEIFLAENGDIVISLVSRRKRCLENTNLSRNMALIVRTKQAKNVRRAYAMGADYKGEKPVKMRRKGKTLFLTIPVHGAASLIVLEKAAGKNARATDLI